MFGPVRGSARFRHGLTGPSHHDGFEGLSLSRVLSKIDLADHNGFVAEVKRRLVAAGLREDEMPRLRTRHRPSEAEH
jgi:hypothetical protein